MGAKALPGLTLALTDDNPDVRGRAIETLGKIGDPSVVPALMEHLSDDQRPRMEGKRIRDLAVDALKRLGAYVDPSPKAEPESAGELLPIMDDLPGAFAAGEAPDDEFPVSADDEGVLPVLSPLPETMPPEPLTQAQWDQLDELLKGLHSADWHERREAARALRDGAKGLRGVMNPGVIAQLMRALKDADALVRWAVVEALAWIKDEAPIPDLLRLLHDENWTVRTAAIRALVEIGDRAVLPKLVQALEDQHPLVRETAAEALGRLHDRGAAAGLINRLGDEEPFVRRAAVFALGTLGDPAYALPVARLLDDTDAQVRWTAVESLGRLREPATVGVLKRYLSDTQVPTWETRRMCDVVAEALQAIGSEDGLDAVERWRMGQPVEG
jgi:HEAT repeat protein